MSTPWWQGRTALRRFVVDLVADELGRLRRASLPQSGLWQDALRLDADLGVDSLELVTLATALAEALHLHESGIEDYLLARRTIGEWLDVAAAGLAAFDARLTFRTSGSTGEPKACVHPLAHLQQEVAHLATLFPGRRRVLRAVPAHHIYGFLFTVLMPQALGVEDVLDLRTSTPAWLARGAQPGDLVIGHPAFWQAVLRGVPAWPAGVVGVTSTSPCPDAVAQAVQGAGLSRLVQVYGASETAGIGAREAPGAPYRLFPHWSFGAEGTLLRALPAGGQQAWPVQDALVASGERDFHVGPRHDAAVQVGGTNVFPARVAAVLRRHPDVADAAARLMAPHEGTRLKAFVVPRDGVAPADLALSLEDWIARELTVPERPKALRFGPGLPRNAAGKLADWSLDAPPGSGELAGQ